MPTDSGLAHPNIRTADIGRHDGIGDPPGFLVACTRWVGPDEDVVRSGKMPEVGYGRDKLFAWRQVGPMVVDVAMYTSSGSLADRHRLAIMEPCDALELVLKACATTDSAGIRLHPVFQTPL